MVIKGNTDNAAFVDFINYVFGFNGADRSFEKLLPKLYANGHDGASHNYFVKKEGQIRAAVGAFELTFEICGERMKVCGIGNVAVHPRDRGEGYMKACMKAALDEAIAQGAAFAVLSGRRHRYNYFGFVKCGSDRSYEVSAKTLSYLPQREEEPKLTMRVLDSDDKCALDAIYAHWETRSSFRALRARDDLYDIMISWQSTPYVFFDGEKLAGWAIVKGGDVWEFIPSDLSYTVPMMRLLSSRHWQLSYHIPLFDKAIAMKIFPYAETQFTGADLCFNIFDYERVLGRLFELKSTYEPLLDGSVVVEIDGYAKAERLKLSVAGGIPSVAATEEAPNVKLSHLAAMRALFLPDAPERECFDATVRSWLPLPIYIFHADNV